MQVTVEEAKTILPELCQLAQAGLEVIITKDGQPYIRLVACTDSDDIPKPDRIPGTLKGKIWLSPDFDEPVEFSTESTGPGEQV